MTYESTKEKRYKDLVSALNWLDPSQLDYNEWLGVGFALDYEGFSPSVWDEWSQRDPERYKPFEALKKAKGFNQSQQKTPITGDTIFRLALNRGWSAGRIQSDHPGNYPVYYPVIQPVNTKQSDPIDQQKETEKINRLKKTLKAQHTKEEIFRIPENEWNPENDLIHYLKAVFRPGDIVGYNTNAKWNPKKQKYDPSDIGTFRSVSEIIELLEHGSKVTEVIKGLNQQAGAWIRVNPMDGNGGKDENVTDYRHVLIESDKIPVLDQLSIIHELRLPITALVYSGNKSIHAVVKINASDRKEYRSRVEYLFNLLDRYGLQVDQNNKNESRMSRIPGVIRADQKQFLIETNTGLPSYEEWKKMIISISEDEDADDLELPTMEDFEEKETEWLVKGYIPKGCITILAGTGGTGKSSIWASLLSSLSSGQPTILEGLYGVERDPVKVMYITTEDDIERVVKPKLRKNHANQKNIITMSPLDKRFEKVIIGTQFFEKLIRRHKPALCLIDPLQSFIDPKVRMAERNAMRQTLGHLLTLGMECGTAFIILMHTNKMNGTYGRQRIADSSDMWDIARSVLMLGETGEDELKYISHEKSNYGRLGKTVTFKIVDSVPVFQGYSDKKDRDYILDETKKKNSKTDKNDSVQECINIILSELSDNEGKARVEDIDELLKSLGYSVRNIKDAKHHLYENKMIETQKDGMSGKVDMVRVYEEKS